MHAGRRFSGLLQRGNQFSARLAWLPAVSDEVKAASDFVLLAQQLSKH
jgi:hypothetical protein